MTIASHPPESTVATHEGQYYLSMGRRVHLTVVEIELPAKILLRTKIVLEQCRWREELVSTSPTATHHGNTSKSLENDELLRIGVGMLRRWWNSCH